MTIVASQKSGDDDVHVFPTDDIEEHFTDPGDMGMCWCEPKRELADDGVTVIWVHNRAKDNPQ